MKNNRDLGFTEVASVGNYTIGKKKGAFRAYGYEWDYNRNASQEQAHHMVCGRGKTPEGAIDKMVEAAIIAGRTTESVHNMAQKLGLSKDAAETLRRELYEAIDEVGQ